MEALVLLVVVVVVAVVEGGEAIIIVNEAVIGDEKAFNPGEGVFHGDGIAALDVGGIRVAWVFTFLLDESPCGVQGSHFLC